MPVTPDLLEGEGASQGVSENEAFRTPTGNESIRLDQTNKPSGISAQALPPGCEVPTSARGPETKVKGRDERYS